MNNESLQDDIMPADALQEQDAQEVSKEVNTLKSRVASIAFSLSYLINPEAAILNFTDFQNGTYETWYRNHFETLAKQVADKFNVDVEQVMDRETRTPEQDKELTLLAGEHIMQCFTKFKESNYFQAKTAIKEEKVEFSDTIFKGLENVKTAATLYFFAIHPEINPEDKASLTEENIKELKVILYDMEKYYNKEVQFEQLLEGYGKSIFFKYINDHITSSKAKQEAITLLQSVIPEYHIMPNNSLMNYLSSFDIINAGAVDIPVINKTKKRNEITAYTIASYDQSEEDTKLSAFKLTEYERQVSDAIISIWEESKKQGLPAVFTTDMIYRAMPGSGDKPSTQQQGAITRIIEKFRHLHIYVDVSEEMRIKGKIKENENLVFDDFYLSVRRVTRKIKNGGQTVRAYCLHSEPVILSYCRMTNQLLTVNPKLLEIKKIKKGAISSEPVYMNEERQAITGYLLRRIAIMKRDKQNKKPRQSDIILFASLFEDIGIAKPSRDKALDIRKFCCEVLDNYIAEKYIKGYEKQTKGKSITGLKIIL